METWKEFERDLVMFVVLGFLFFTILLVALYIIPISNEEGTAPPSLVKFGEKNEENASLNETINQTNLPPGQIS